MDDQYLDQFLDAMWMEEGLSQNTLAAYRRDLNKFQQWCSAQEKTYLIYLDLDLQTFLFWLFENDLKKSTRARMVAALRRYFQYLYRVQIRLDDPSTLLKAPKLSQRLPKHLTENQVTALLDAPDPDNLH